MNRGTRDRRKLLVFLLSALATVAGLEGGARLYLGEDFVCRVVTDTPMESLVVADGDLGWRNSPHLTGRVVGPSLRFPMFEYGVRINADGFRGRALPDDAGTGAMRVVVLGDSFPWGWGVEEEEAYPQVLEGLLGPGAKVYNLGVPGYSTDQ